MFSSTPSISSASPKKKKKKRSKKGSHIASDADLEGDDGQFGIFTKPSTQELALMEDSMTSVQTGELQEFQIATRDEIEEKEKAKANHDPDDDADTNFDRMVERKVRNLKASDRGCRAAQLFPSYATIT